MGAAAYITGYTLSNDFLITPGAYDTTIDGTRSDSFVTKISEPSQDWTTTYTYAYDPLYRLAGADYSSGEYFTYTLRLRKGQAYDAVGNRLSETTDSGTTTYAYDIANRLTQADYSTIHSFTHLFSSRSSTTKGSYMIRLLAFSRLSASKVIKPPERSTKGPPK
jgi:YD repeat-containing protein